MIISASRRTDIPAFYGKWLLNRLSAGFVMVRNPVNRHRVSRIELNPAKVDCIVLWTRNPESFLPYLPDLGGYCYYFQCTLTPYGRRLEPHVPDARRRLELFKKLSDAVGPKRIIWRYDPIILTHHLDIRYHAEAYESIAAELRGFTSRCVISFLDLYRSTRRNLSAAGLRPIDIADMKQLAEPLAAAADRNGMKIFTCAEEVDLAEFGILPGKCIDDSLIAELTHQSLTMRKDKSQRKECRCVTSVDIGAYDTCPQGCLYCYASQNRKVLAENLKQHDPDSPLILGNVEPEDSVVERAAESHLSVEQDLFRA